MQAKLNCINLTPDHSVWRITPTSTNIESFTVIVSLDNAKVNHDVDTIVVAIDKCKKFIIETMQIEEKELLF